MKKRKQMLLFGSILLAFIGCGKTTTKDRFLLDKKEYGTVYFVRGMIDTEMAVSCNNYLNHLDFFISYLKINDEKLIDSLLCCSEVDEKLGSNYFIDVRYRIELEDKVICIDDVGNYSIEGKYLGKLSDFQLLLDYIETHRASSIKLKEDFPFVDDK